MCECVNVWMCGSVEVWKCGSVDVCEMKTVEMVDSSGADIKVIGVGTTGKLRARDFAIGKSYSGNFSFEFHLVTNQFDGAFYCSHSYID